MTATQQIPPDVQQQLTMLRDYCRTLESQNNSRNEERKILEKEIQRLAKVQKEREKRGSINKECQECRKYKSQIIRLQNTVERLQKQNNNLQESYNFVSGSLTQRTQRIERVQVRQVDGSNITLGAGGSIGSVALQQLEDKIKDLQKKNTDQTNKYKDLIQKYDTINSQNQNLKLKLQQTTKQTNNTFQSQISSLTSQKHNLSIQLSSLQQQLHKIKSLVSQKQQQIFNIKNKQSLQSSTNQLELKALKDSVVSKDKEIGILRDRLKQFGDCQFQIRGLRADLVNKKQQIDILKQDINRCEDEINKVYKLQTDIRNLKYQLTQRDTQIQKLKKKSSQLSSSQLQKLSTMQSTISTLTSTLSSKQSQLKNIRQQNNQIPSLLSQISKYQTQIQTLKSQMIDLQSKPIHQINSNSNSNPLSETLTHYTGQIADLNIDVGRLRGQIKEKEEYIRRVEDQLREMMRRDEEKNLEVKKLDKIVNSYVQKIGQLQIQLNRIQKTTSIQQPQPSPQLNQTFNPSPQLELLTNQNQALNLKIQSLEHRIAILQQTNRNLREQLRLSIELRNRDRETSRISMVPVQPVGIPIANGEMEELLATIRMLKGEVDEMRTINNKAKLDNQYLQAKLSAAEIQIDGLIGFGKGIQIGRIRQQTQAPKRDLGIVATNKILANMPIVETSKMYQPNPLPKSPSTNFRPKQHAYTVLDDNERDPMSSTTPIQSRPSQPLFSSTTPVPYRSSLQERSRPMVQTSKLSSTSSMIPVSNISSEVNDSKMRRRQESGRSKADVGELQKRIEMLKQENKGLRKHLYDGGA